jgi:hypothetical protein
MTARVPLKKESLVGSLKGLDAKTDWLAVNRQSLSTRNFDFDFDFDLSSQSSVGDSDGKMVVEEELEVSLCVWLEDAVTVRLFF